MVIGVVALSIAYNKGMVTQEQFVWRLISVPFSCYALLALIRWIFVKISKIFYKMAQ